MNTSEKDIREALKHAWGVNWSGLSSMPGLSEAFIHDYAEYVDWEVISGAQTLSEQFILEHAEYVYWPNIYKYQDLSPQFIRNRALNVKCKALWDNVSSGPRRPDSFYIKYHEHIRFDLVVAKHYLPQKLVDELIRLGANFPREYTTIKARADALGASADICAEDMSELKASASTLLRMITGLFWPRKN